LKPRALRKAEIPFEVREAVMAHKKVSREKALAITGLLDAGRTPEQIVRIFGRHGVEITLAQIAYMQRRIERLGAFEA
jgi:hypothetical protein